MAEPSCPAHPCWWTTCCRRWVIGSGCCRSRARWRCGFSYDAPLLAAIAGRLARAVMQDMRRGVKQQHGLASVAALHAGGFTVVQRFRSDLGLYVHLHCLATDGAYEEQNDGALRFLAAPPPTPERMTAVLAWVHEVVHAAADDERVDTREPGVHPAVEVNILLDRGSITIPRVELGPANAWLWTVPDGVDEIHIDELVVRAGPTVIHGPPHLDTDPHPGKKLPTPTLRLAKKRAYSIPLRHVELPRRAPRPGREKRLPARLERPRGREGRPHGKDRRHHRLPALTRCKELRSSNESPPCTSASFLVKTSSPP